MSNGAMAGKVVLVTGANNGVGRETALGLAHLGAHIVMTARNESKGEAARQEIIDKTKNRNVDLLQVDFSSQASIRQFAETFIQRYDRLDVLINNAGAMNSSRSTTIDGLEMTFAVNHLGYFLTTMLLTDIIKKSAPARIVNVGSTAHRGAKLNFDDLQSTRGYQFFGAYGQSKLANVMFTYELARRLEGSGVTANVLHPGLVRTGFAKSSGPLLKIGVTLLGPFMTSSARGAETSIYLASSASVDGVTGRYFEKMAERASSEASQDAEAQRRLWEISESLTAGSVKVSV